MWGLQCHWPASARQLRCMQALFHSSTLQQLAVHKELMQQNLWRPKLLQRQWWGHRQHRNCRGPSPQRSESAPLLQQQARARLQQTKVPQRARCSQVFAAVAEKLLRRETHGNTCNQARIAAAAATRARGPANMLNDCNVLQ